MSHHLPNGRFTNPWPSAHAHGVVSFLSVIFRGDFSLPSPPPISEQVKLVQDIDLDLLNQPVVEGTFRAVWLGHASFLVQFPGNVGVLTDPIFSERCSPVQFAGPKRHVKPPCRLEDIKPWVNVVVISHSHYDHMDLNTLKVLGSQPIYFVPLKNRTWILDNVDRMAKVYECDWWAEHILEELSGLRIACTPCQHFSGRGLLDRNATLWSSWCLIHPKGGRFYFAGDTGYRHVPNHTNEDDAPTCPAFKEIGERYGPFDLATIPIGAYYPRDFMSPVHANPEDAVRIHQDVKSRKSIGMHWGTFPMTAEPVFEPPELLKKACEKHELKEGTFITVKIGETTMVSTMTPKE